MENRVSRDSLEQFLSRHFLLLQKEAQLDPLSLHLFKDPGAARSAQATHQSSQITGDSVRATLNQHTTFFMASNQNEFK